MSDLPILFGASKCVTVLLLCCVGAFAQAQRLGFPDLPKEIRDHVLDVRRACKEVLERDDFYDMQGISVLDLKGDGARDIIIDNEGLCGTHIAGTNCSNRGCDMIIYKEIHKNRWRKIFEEHLYDKHLVIDWDHMRLQMLVASLYAGDPSRNNS
jgi:hypothetical protein